MLRNLAVGIDAGPHSQVPLRQAVQLASVCSARLHVLAALEEGTALPESLPGSPEAPVLEVDLPSDPTTEPLTGLPPHVERARQVCHEEAVACRLHLHRGDPWPWLSKQALLAQVLVVGRRSGRAGSGSPRGRTLRRLLLDPEVPLLLCGRDVMESRPALALYRPDGAGARALALVAELCAGLNAPLSVIAAASERQEAARGLAQARDALYAYQLDCDFTAVEGPAPAALLELSLERHPSLVAIPAEPRPLRSFLSHPLCRAALDVPEAAALVVP